MPNLSNDSKDFIREMMKSEGWRLYKAAVLEQAVILRRQATEQKVGLEDRLWDAALAKGYEGAVDYADVISKK